MAVASIPQEYRSTITDLSVKVIEAASAREAILIGVGGKLQIPSPLDTWKIDLAKWEIEFPDPKSEESEEKPEPLGTAPPKKKKE